jgi:hypothetical protein
MIWYEITGMICTNAAVVALTMPQKMFYILLGLFELLRRRRRVPSRFVRLQLSSNVCIRPVARNINSPRRTKLAALRATMSSLGNFDALGATLSHLNALI